MLRVHSEEVSTGRHPDRDAQFLYIRSQRQIFSHSGNPVVSVDTKKKELVGRFKNPGQVWSREAIPVNDHDFRSQADGFAIPYGLCDLQNNLGAVFVGTSQYTPAFAVDAIVAWWNGQGQALYEGKSALLILADGGGSNGSRSRAWKFFLQEKLCNGNGLPVTVFHYPPGASKWNPMEHRLFSEISKHWAGHPLDSFETILNYLRTTKTETGLRVTAAFADPPYETGIKISQDQRDRLSILPHDSLPQWNDTLQPIRM